jgi:hypothetical protein
MTRRAVCSVPRQGSWYNDDRRDRIQSDSPVASSGVVLSMWVVVLVVVLVDRKCKRASRDLLLRQQERERERERNQIYIRMTMMIHLARFESGCNIVQRYGYPAQAAMPHHASNHGRSSQNSSRTMSS